MSDQASVRWGATPEDWNHFADTLGLKRDLLPVVSNPDAVISPKSRMKDKGKTPSRYNREGLIAGIPEWTDNETTDFQLGTWVAQPDYGICVQTKVVRAFDIDIKDPEHSREVREFIELTLGELPVRRRADSGKQLLAFRLPDTELKKYTKRVIKTEHGIIEFLATGQQFIAVGTHQDGARYEWEGGLPGSIPELSHEEFEQVWLALVQQFAIEAPTELDPGAKPLVPRVASDVNDPVVKWLYDNDWVKGSDDKGFIHVRCPWQHEHSDPDNESDSSSTYLPAGLGGFAQGHYKCLHGHCDGKRTDDEFLAAIGFNIADEFEVIEASPDDPPPWPSLVRDRNGKIEPTADNTHKLFNRPDITGVRLGWDEFLAALMIARDDEAWQARPLKDHDYFELRIRLEKAGMKKPSKELVRDACHFVGWQHKNDSAKAWINGLKWDGVERIERFFIDYFGCEDTPYVRAVGKYWWSALAARATDPGHQCDMVPVLCGLQGIGKTQGVKAMAPSPEQFAVIHMDKSDDVLARLIRGKLVGELGELKGLRTREVEDIKERITRTHEEWTPKYLEHNTVYPRRIMFIGTSNEHEFLSDSTGNRRWLPLVATSGDPARIAADRDQLWAEGAVVFAAEGVVWRDAEVLAREVHEKHMEVDPWQDAIINWLREVDEFDRDDDAAPRWHAPFTAAEIGAACLNTAGYKATKADANRIGAVLRTLGFTKKTVRQGHLTGTKWVPTAECKLL